MASKTIRKASTIYTQNYIDFWNERDVCRKYAILSAFTQSPDNQSVAFTIRLFAFQIPHYALRLGIFRTSKHA